LAFNEDKPVGIIGYFTKADHPDSRYIFSMWVNENFRNKSIGKSLVQHVIEAATLQGADTVVTGYASSNPQARGFYEGLGFSETGRQIPLMRDPSVKEIEMMMEISTRTTRE